MLASAVVGGAILRRQVPALLSEGARRLVEGEAVSEQVLVRRSLLSLAGVLIAVPGLLTTAIGLMVVLPPIRVLAGLRLRPLVAQSFPMGFAVPFSANRRSPRRRDVVDVDVVTDDIRKSARPELN
jgi:UPF0716 protein FxsA